MRKNTSSSIINFCYTDYSAILYSISCSWNRISYSLRNTKTFRLLTQSCYNLKMFIKPVYNDGTWDKQCHNGILIENIASMNAIIFAIQYSDHMTYLMTTQKNTQLLRSKTDLCKCDHLEFHHVDEEGHGACRYCSCDQFDPQWSTFLYYPTSILQGGIQKLIEFLSSPSNLLRIDYVDPLFWHPVCSWHILETNSMKSMKDFHKNLIYDICQNCTNNAYIATFLHRFCIFCVKRCSIIYASLSMPSWRMQ